MNSPSPVVACDVPAVASLAPVRGALAARAVDYLQIAKPRISLLVLLTVAAGFSLAPVDTWQPLVLVHALGGIALVAAASSAFNQVLERESDALMRRTRNRPLPAGRMSLAEVSLFGLATGSFGVVWLAVFVNPATAVLAALTLVLYAGVYTPLKRRTSFGTAVGAIPGAMPPVLGWVAAGAPLDAAAFSLFGILFLWQFPHFLAIAWIYREEYAKAGLKMLPAGGSARYLTGILAVAYALALLPLSLLPAASTLAGTFYLIVALCLSLLYVGAAVRFAVSESYQTARTLLWTSLVYLPVLLATLVWDHFSLLS